MYLILLSFNISFNNAIQQCYICFIKLMEKLYSPQVLPKKVVISRKLRLLNFGRQDHKRKAWWTISSLQREEEYRIKCKVFWADAIRYARKRFAECSQSSTSDRKKEYRSAPPKRRWLISIIRVVMFLCAVLFAFSNQFGKEYSSCTAGDGPPKKIQRTADDEEHHSIAAGNFTSTKYITNHVEVKLKWNLYRYSF